MTDYLPGLSVASIIRSAGLGPRFSIRRNRMRCPIHNGDNPQSFSIMEDKGAAHCFRCGWSGGKLDLIVALGLASSKKEAYRWASVKLGLSTENDPRQKEIAQRARRDTERMAYWFEWSKFCTLVDAESAEWDADLYWKRFQDFHTWETSKIVSLFREFEAQFGFFKLPRILVLINRVMDEVYGDGRRLDALLAELSAHLGLEFGEDDDRLAAARKIALNRMLVYFVRREQYLREEASGKEKREKQSRVHATGLGEGPVCDGRVGPDSPEDDF